MTDKEFKKYTETIISMCVDYLMNGITRETLTANLKLVIKQLQQKQLPKRESDLMTGSD